MEYPPFNIHTRKELLARISSGGVHPFDAVIVGGGIVGAGLARELAIRGINALLVEKGDFASGTSSRSSKLIHGGLRYLEMGDFNLVFEALAERHWLIKTHPHLIQPVEFNVPIYKKKWAPKGARSTALIGLGLWLYDGLSLFRTPFFHGRHSKEEVCHRFPFLKDEGLKGSYFYPDAMMCDDELVLETLLDARRRGASLLNYVEAQSVSGKNSSGCFEVLLGESLGTEQASLAQASLAQASLKPIKTFIVKAKEVFVCVGPWTERFGTHVAGGACRRLKPSKGVHLIIPWERLPIKQCLVMYAPDGRIVFAIPRTDLGPGAECVIIGTTDSPESCPPEKVSADLKDVDYLLAVLKTYFPGVCLTQDDIAMTYAGIRPLIDSGKESEAKTSREHEIWRNKAGIVFMAGGKYTTFRKISQELADFTFPKSLSLNRESKKPLSLPSDYAERLKGKALWGRYTDEWFKWKIEHHCPLTLEDLVFRRSAIWMGGKNVTKGVIDEVLEIARVPFGLNVKESARQKERVYESLKEGSGWHCRK